MLDVMLFSWGAIRRQASAKRKREPGHDARRGAVRLFCLLTCRLAEIRVSGGLRCWTRSDLPSNDAASHPKH